MVETAAGFSMILLSPKLTANTHENRVSQKEKSSSNHQFSGAMQGG